MTGQHIRLQMENINIEFPGVKALTNVNFSMESGTISALIGANGAGKSTLMKVLSGAYEHYSGRILFNNQEVTIKTPKDAKNLGIDIVYQEVDTALIPNLTVGENIMLNELVHNMNKKQLVNWKKVHTEAKAVLERLNITMDTKKLVKDLDLADKQMVLIARAIIKERKFLILDEPTAPLSDKETKELFRVVRDLAANHNIGVIFISHRLPELFEICETITVMKDGKIVATGNISEFSTKQVVEYMLGKSINENTEKAERNIGEDPILEIKNLSDKLGKVKNISIHVKPGEIIGIAGLVGAGKTELVKTIYGDHLVESGTVAIKGKMRQIKTPHHAVKYGLALVPEERRKEGVMVEEPIYKNLTAASLNKFTGILHFLKPKKEREASVEMINTIGVKTPDERQKVSLLSGGNQQKVAVGKWLLSEAEVYMFDEQTKGVDVGAKTEIYELIRNLASHQKGIIYASSEMTEIMTITDRVYVMYDNEIVKELDTKNTSEEEIMYYSTGGK